MTDRGPYRHGSFDTSWDFGAAGATGLSVFANDAPITADGTALLLAGRTSTAAAPGASGQAPGAAPQQIVFIEGSVPDAELLAAGVAPGVTAVILNPDADGVTQIADYLTRNNITSLAAIDIVAHGDPGQVALGTATLDTDSIPQYQAALGTIGAALQPSGDIQIYGCDVGADTSGSAFLQALSAATGGANIAASSSLVGASDAGGSWSLNVDVGTVDVSSPFTPAAEAAYPGELATATDGLFVSFFYGAETSITNGFTADAVQQLSVTGATLNSSTSIIDGKQETFAGLQGVAVDAPLQKYFVINSNADTANQILEGSTTGGTASSVYSTSTPLYDYQLFGLALDQPAGELYFGQSAYSGTVDVPGSSDGIFGLNVATDVVTSIVTGQGIQSPQNLSLDLTNNLVFFVDDGSSNDNLDYAGLAAGSTLHILNGSVTGALHTALNHGAFLEDVAADPAAGELIVTIGPNGTLSTYEGIYSVSYSVSGGVVTLGSSAELYSAANAGGLPLDLTVDQATGDFYVAINSYNASNNTTSDYVSEGSITATNSSALTVVDQVTQTIGSTAEASMPVGMALLSTPTISASGSVTYLQGGSAATLDSGATVGNSDGTELDGATIAVSGGDSADGDTLAAVTTGTSITATYNAATETLTLSGADTAADYQKVIDSVTFASTSGTAATRTIDWSVTNGILSSGTATSSVAIHVKPTVIASGTTTYAGGDTSSVKLDGGLTLSVPSSTTLASATVVIGGFISGDSLTVANAGSLTVSFNSGGTLTLSGSASVSTYQTALDSVGYIFNPTDGDPTDDNTHTSRSISWSVNDGSLSSTTASTTLDVTHTAPTITAGATATYHVGDVSDVLDSGIIVTDPDSGNLLAGATVTVGSGFTNGDTLLFSNQNGITGSYNDGVLSLSGVASINDYETALDTVRYTFSGGDPTVGGTDPSRTIDWTVNDGAATGSEASSTLLTSDVPCFCRGTRILTERGEVAVETLAPGDRVVTLSGAERPIQWIGFGRALVTPANRCDVAPVIVRRGALADNVPSRDLYVTRRHAFLVDDVLVPVEHLINGISVLWDDTARVIEYYHIELDAHDVLLADGAPAESFRDDDSRHLFQNQMCRPPRDEPDPPCAPVVTSGPRLDQAWKRVASRVGPVWGERLERDADPHLVVAGRRIDPLVAAAGMVRFRIEAAAGAVIGDVILASRTCIPAAYGLGPDRRRLGLGVFGLCLSHAPGEREVGERELDMASAELALGFHACEGGLRWTKGRATLPASLFAGMAGPVELTLRVAGDLLYPRETVRYGQIPTRIRGRTGGRIARAG
jgi:hypothetical protein